MTDVGDHDWQRIELVSARSTEVFRWRCRQCGAVVRANDSAGIPGTIYFVVIGLDGLSCAETVLLREVHET